MLTDVVWKSLIWLTEWGFISLLVGFYITAIYP